MVADEWMELSIKVGEVFTPSAPVDVKQLFAGRKEQLIQIADVINQKGQHAIIFGERGVGKTSLANVITAIFSSSDVKSLRKNCDSADDYTSLWKKILEEIKLFQQNRPMGFNAQTSLDIIPLANLVDDEITPDKVRQALSLISSNVKTILIIDEFDRLSIQNARSAMADTIKTLSDHAVNTTLILVGVADSVDELIKEHQSIERALVQIKMPRMSDEEIRQIIDTRLPGLDMTIDDNAKNHITLLSRGLPHYTHLLALHSARKALDNKSRNITLRHVEESIPKALQQSHQTSLSTYNKAVSSPQKETIFRQVLLACAFARTDDLGFFAAADVREPLSTIMKKPYEIPSFSGHLYAFCESERGPILSKKGKPRSFRFRFINPLLQPFVIMQGFSDGLIDTPTLEVLRRK